MLRKDDLTQSPFEWQAQASTEESPESFVLAEVSHTLERQIFWNIFH